MKATALSLPFLLALAPMIADAQTIGGTVVEEPGRMAISGATVVLVGDGDRVTSVRTDSSGGFRFTLEHGGRFVLRVSHPSYLSVRSDTLAVDEDEAVTVELRMARNAIPIEPLVVTARVDRRLRAFHERAQKGLSFGRFVTRADIERRPGLGVAQLLRGVPGVRLAYLSPCSGCAAEEVVYLRGGAGECMPTVLIDGMAVKQDASFPLDALLTADMLDGIEVYVNGAAIPAELGPPSSSCGVVAFWTRSPEGGKLTWKRLAVAVGIIVVLFVLLH